MALDPKAHPAAGGSELEGVREEVGHHLSDPPGIDEDLAELAVRLDRQVDPAIEGERVASPSTTSTPIAATLAGSGRDRAAPTRSATCRGSRRAGRGRGRRSRRCRWRGAAGPPAAAPTVGPHQVGEHPDRRERSAHLVGEGGDEPALRLGGVLGAGAALAQLDVGAVGAVDVAQQALQEQGPEEARPAPPRRAAPSPSTLPGLPPSRAPHPRELRGRRSTGRRAARPSTGSPHRRSRSPPRGRRGRPRPAARPPVAPGRSRRALGRRARRRPPAPASRRACARSRGQIRPARKLAGTAATTATVRSPPGSGSRSGPPVPLRGRRSARRRRGSRRAPRAPRAGSRARPPGRGDHVAVPVERPGLPAHAEVLGEVRLAVIDRIPDRGAQRGGGSTQEGLGLRGGHLRVPEDVLGRVVLLGVTPSRAARSPRRRRTRAGPGRAGPPPNAGCRRETGARRRSAHGSPPRVHPAMARSQSLIGTRVALRGLRANSGSCVPGFPIPIGVSAPTLEARPAPSGRSRFGLSDPDPVAVGDGGGLGAAADVELGEDPRDVDAGRLLGHEQALADLAVGRARCDQRQAPGARAG